MNINDNILGVKVMPITTDDELLDAIRAGKTVDVLQFAADYPDYKDKSEIPLLHLAVMYGSGAMMSALIDKSPAGRKHDNKTALHLAASGRHTAKMLALVGKYPYLVGAPDYSGNTTLHLIALESDVEILSAVAKTNLEALQKKNREGKTPIDVFLDMHFNSQKDSMRNQRHLPNEDNMRELLMFVPIKDISKSRLNNIARAYGEKFISDVITEQMEIPKMVGQPLAPVNRIVMDYLGVYMPTSKARTAAPAESEEKEGWAQRENNRRASITFTSEQRGQGIWV
jgi:hypothetical protein